MPGKGAGGRGLHSQGHQKHGHEREQSEERRHTISISPVNGFLNGVLAAAGDRKLDRLFDAVHRGTIAS
jgi:hypothetical protein